jgi:beta-glucanase (GH16 family)
MKITEKLNTNLNTLGIGSSIMNRWNNISLDLSQPVLNVGIEGSTVKQWLPNAAQNYWNTKIVTNQTSPVMLVYLGSNDISDGDDAATVYNNTILFLNELLNLNSNIQIIYLSVIRSPSKQAAGKISIVNSVNTQVQSWISNLGTRIYYADINTYLADIDGNPLEAELFLSDGRHLTSLGYTKLTQVVKPLLTTVLSTNPIDAQGYKLVWMDDFNGTGINTNYWSPVDNYDGANGELQFYTSRTGAAGNLNVSGSKLYLTARSGSYTAQGPWMPAPATTQFTSALIESLNKKEFQYGKIQANIKMPSGLGLWPAFWMLGDNYFTAGFPLCGEIDIMEHANVQPNYTSALHTFNRNHTIPAGGWAQGKELPSDYYNQFYTYGTEWTSTGISFYLNNTGFFTVTTGQAGTGVQDWPFNQPFWLKLNLAVGGSYGGSPNDGDWTIPHSMEVDWVKVYQK